MKLNGNLEEDDELSRKRFFMARAKLKSTRSSSKLLTVFAMMIMLEVQLNSPDSTSIPDWLFVIFLISTTLLASVHILALMISSIILPVIEMVAKFIETPMISESPHDRLKQSIETARVLSSVLGLLLFLFELVILCWVKFWDFSVTACIFPTAVVCPVIFFFIGMVIYFYKTLVIIKYKSTMSDIEKLDDLWKQLDASV